jgi:hypothetical protein
MRLVSARASRSKYERRDRRADRPMALANRKRETRWVVEMSGQESSLRYLGRDHGRTRHAEKILNPDNQAETLISERMRDDGKTHTCASDNRYNSGLRECQKDIKCRCNGL